MTDLNRLIDGLTPAKKRALLWLNPDGSARDHGRGDPREVSFYAMLDVIVGDPTKEIANIYSLVQLGRGEKKPGSIWPPNTWAATPLGLAVRNALLAKENRHG